MISAEFAEKLGVKVGGRATLIGSTVMGAMAVHNFIIAGTVNFGVMAMARGAMIADIGDVQYLLDMPDSSGEILGFRKDLIYFDEESSISTKQRAKEIVEAFVRYYLEFITEEVNKEKT